MIDIKRLISDCEAIIGWPYSSPGTNDERGIDCSGMLVRAYQLQGASIYHGSNRIIRAHCGLVRQITGEADLAHGMVVFKRREDGQEPAEYKPGGKYYDPALVGNFYHIGLVASVNPLRIVHATTPVAKVDTVLGNWTWCAYLLDGNYFNAVVDVADDVKPQAVSQQLMRVNTNDSGLTFRKEPKIVSGVDNRVPAMPRIPKDATVTVNVSNGQGWANVAYGGYTGWVSEMYLAPFSALVDKPVDYATNERINIELTSVEARVLLAIADKIRFG
jgi:hypothetical protein